MTDSEDANLVKHLTDNEEPSIATSKSEREDPNRPKLRSESAEPIVEASKTEIVEPIRTKLRNDTEEPRVKISCKNQVKVSQGFHTPDYSLKIPQKNEIM